MRLARISLWCTCIWAALLVLPCWPGYFQRYPWLPAKLTPWEQQDKMQRIKGVVEITDPLQAAIMPQMYPDVTAALFLQANDSRLTTSDHEAGHGWRNLIAYI
jgi:hypothetical protein